MKRFIYALTIAAALCTTAQAQENAANQRGGQANPTGVAELPDTLANRKEAADIVGDTPVEAVTLEEEAKSFAEAVTDIVESQTNIAANQRKTMGGMKENTFDMELLVPLFAIVFGSAMPILIVFFIFYFRQKNRQAKYKLAEQALANGQPLPEGLFQAADTPNNIRVKGIKNICLGLGLFIFLWALCDDFSIGCIGLLILLMGVGQLVIYYTQPPTPEAPANPQVENRQQSVGEVSPTPPVYHPQPSGEASSQTAGDEPKQAE